MCAASQWHDEFRQTPLPEQPFGQAGCEQSVPAHPRSQAHCPDWHAPRCEQLFRHASAEQSAPPKPALHWHAPPTHAPWPEHVPSPGHEANQPARARADKAGRSSIVVARALAGAER